MGFVGAFINKRGAIVERNCVRGELWPVNFLSEKLQNILKCYDDFLISGIF